MTSLLVPILGGLFFIAYGILMYFGGYAMATIYWTGKTPHEHRVDGTPWRWPR